MSLLPRTLLALGSILLIHACYSAHEHSSLASSPSSSSSSPTPSPPAPSFPTTPSTPQPPPSALPLDIALETLAAVLLLCIALVLGAEDLRPIRWRVWAGEVEHGAHKARATGELTSEGGEIGGKGKGKGVGSGVGAGGEGFEWLEGGKRRGFLDIRGLRRGFAGWMREEGGEK